MPRDYPDTVTEILDNNMTFKPETLLAMRTFKRSKPWSGTAKKRKEKLRKLNRTLSSIYGVPEPTLVFGELDGSSSGGSHYRPGGHAIVLSGRLSVVTFLHEFCHARGMNEREACRWSVNLFRRVFPREFARLAQEGHMLVRLAKTPQGRY